MHEVEAVALPGDALAAGTDGQVLATSLEECPSREFRASDVRLDPGVGFGLRAGAHDEEAHLIGESCIVGDGQGHQEPAGGEVMVRFHPLGGLAVPEVPGIPGDGRRGRGRAWGSVELEAAYLGARDDELRARYPEVEGGNPGVSA